jgi:hypothetical protein
MKGKSVSRRRGAGWAEAMEDSRITVEEQAAIVDSGKVGEEIEDVESGSTEVTDWHCTNNRSTTTSVVLKLLRFMIPHATSTSKLQYLILETVGRDGGL